MPFRLIILISLLLPFYTSAQLVINEGSNRNYAAIADEDAEHPDWIELYNAGTDTIQLLNYSLTDDSLVPAKWTFPNIVILPGEFRLVFCSGKNRKPITGFKNVISEISYVPNVGWNTHNFNAPFYWDGVSSLLVNTCSYSSTGYTSNSVFNQTTTSYFSSLSAFQDGSPNICGTTYGTMAMKRPNMKLNNFIIGNGTLNNSPYDYPAPYGNWYWAAKNQMVIPAAELVASGLTAGNIHSLSFDVVSSDPNTSYDYFDCSMKLISYNAVNSTFESADTNLWMHTNFKISSAGETVFLYSPTQQLLSKLYVNVAQLDVSNGLQPDGSSSVVLFATPTPESSNNNSQGFSNYLLPPTFSVPSGQYNNSLSVTISNPNTIACQIRYTLNGDDPDTTSALYTGLPISVYFSGVLKAKAFSDSAIGSTISASSYLIGISHVTPVLSIVTDPENLYGNDGIFDNWQFDWEKAAHVDYFDSLKHLIFSQKAGIQIDGGAGGSRSHPQHSMRVELDDPVLGDGEVNYPLVGHRPSRNKFGRFYLRNGSNYFLTLPYKDAALLECVGEETKNYYSAWSPISVYINGSYFGLYEMREKFDEDYFDELENADADSTDILSLSYWNGGILRAVRGSVDSFYTAYNNFSNLNTNDTSYWSSANQYFDMLHYNDYIIAETYAGNIDWPGNNIKIYRSDKTNFSWRFCLIDLEGSMNPNGFSTASDDHIAYALNGDPNNPYINIFKRSILNPRFKKYFINRYADLMNTSYRYSRLKNVTNKMFNQTVIEMPKEFARWGNPNNINGQMSAFVTNHQTLLSEMAIRTAVVRNNIQSNFSLTSQVDITLDVFPLGAGKIKLNTIIPDSLPFTGVYFHGNPIQMTALANPGFEFAYWDTNAVINAIDTNFSIEKDVPTATVFRAVFQPTNSYGKLNITEVNYNSDSTRNAGNWIEFKNIATAPLNISGYTFSDSTANNVYTFVQGTVIQPGDYLVLAEDTSLFHAQHPNTFVYGPTGFGFSNKSEPLTLYDVNQIAVVTMHYRDSLPWPIAADGYGRTLELLNDSLNPALASSWFPGCIGGSPGTTYVDCNEPILFTEINYNSSESANAGDWIELYNATNNSIDISGYTFKDDDDTHQFIIPSNTQLASHAYYVLVANSILFENRFDTTSNFVGSFPFGLSSKGEAVRLFDQTGKLVQSLVYDELAPWPAGANAVGYTLELSNYADTISLGSSWQVGCLEGSPGKMMYFPCSTSDIQASENNPVSIYPNPSTEKFNVHFASDEMISDSQIQVYDYFGRCIHVEMNRKSAANLEITLPTNASSGMYLLRINSDDHVWEKVLLKQ